MNTSHTNNVAASKYTLKGMFGSLKQALARKFESAVNESISGVDALVDGFKKF